MGSSNPLFGSAWGQKVMKNVDGYFLPNASSACSPAVLSPEERPSLLTRRQNTASTNGGIIPSVPDCMSINKSADALPVLSPSNDLSLERAICDSLFQTSFDRESSDSRASSFPNPETPILSPTQIRAKEDPVLVSIVEGLGFTLPSVGHSDTRWWVSNPLRPSETSGMGDQQLSNDIESQVGGGNQPGPSAPPGSFGRNDRAFLRQNVGIITPPAENNDIGWGDTKISNHLASTPNFDLQIEDASPPSGDQHTPADEAASVVAAATAAGELIEHWLQPALVSLGRFLPKLENRMKKPGIWKMLTSFSVIGGRIRPVGKLCADSLTSVTFTANTGKLFPAAHQLHTTKTSTKPRNVDQCITRNPRSAQPLRLTQSSTNDTCTTGWWRRLLQHQGV